MCSISTCLKKTLEIRGSYDFKSLDKHITIYRKAFARVQYFTLNYYISLQFLKMRTKVTPSFYETNIIGLAERFNVVLTHTHIQNNVASVIKLHNSSMFITLILNGSLM